MKSVFYAFSVVCLLLAVTATKAAAPNDDMFAKANTEFAAGNFKVAIKDYSAVVQAGEDRPARGGSPGLSEKGDGDGGWRPSR